MRIGLTGGIASGKSLISGILKGLGAHVLDADAASREAVRPGSEGLAAVAEEFGPGVLTPQGELDRRGLGEIVFSDRAARMRLNAILHPRIKEILLDKAAEIEARAPGAVIVLEVPLLIECGWQGMVDRVWVAEAPVGQRIDRIMERDGLSRDEAMERIAAQLSDRERAEHAHAVIENRGTVEELENRVAALYAALGEHEEEESQGQRAVDAGGCAGADRPAGADRAGPAAQQGAGEALV